MEFLYLVLLSNGTKARPLSFHFTTNFHFMLMRIYTILYLLLLIVPFKAGAQKLDLDGKKIKTNLIRLPEKALPGSTRTYTVQFKDNYNLTAWGFDPEAVRNEYFRLDGFEQVTENGDLTLEFKMSPIRFLDAVQKNRKSESKDKSGRVTTTYAYWYEITYEKGFTAKMLDKGGAIVWDYTKGLNALMRSSTSTYTTSEFATSKQAYDAYYGNRANDQRERAGQEIRNNFAAIRNALNVAYGYTPVEQGFSIFTSDSKKHPENENFVKAAEDCKLLFASIAADGIAESTLADLNKLLDYYKATAEKYSSTEKVDQKLRYACYYNLAIISLYIDRPDDTILWAGKIVENDYEKKDAKELTKDAEELKALLQKVGVSSRRFKR